MADQLEQQLMRFLANPDDARRFELLEEQLFLEGRWQELADLYQARLAAPGLSEDVRARTQLLFRLGQVLEERLCDPEQAVHHYWAAARLDPSFRPALRQLRTIHRAREQWDMVLQIAELESQLPMRPFELADFSTELGLVWLTHLEDPGQALDCFERALEAREGHTDASIGRARALEGLGRHAEAAAAWQQLADVQRGPDRAPTLVALARLTAGPLRDPERAGDLYRRALADDPRHEEAIEALSVIACAREQWDLMSDLYERRFDVAAGAKRRTNVALEAAQLCLERLHDTRSARMWAERARELCPEEAQVFFIAADVERLAGRQDDLREMLDRAVALAGERAPLSALLETAELHAEAGDEARACELLSRARDVSPEDPLVLEALSDSLGRLERWPDLIQVLECRASLAADDPEAEREVLVELGRIHAEHLDDPDAASDVWERALGRAPGGDVTARLERLYRKHERWRELRSLLERSCTDGSAQERAPRCVALGELLATHFGDAEGARAAFEQALALEPGSARAIQGLAQAARASGDEDAVLVAAERELAASPEPDRIYELVLECVPLWRERDRGEEALQWLERARRARPESRRLLELSVELQEELGHHDALVASLRRLDALVAGPEQGALRRRLATLAAGDPAEAARCYEAALESDPRDRHSLSALDALYRELGRPEERARVLRRRVDGAPRGESSALLRELAEVLDSELGDVDGAAVVWWRIRQEEGGSAELDARLEAVLERGSRYEEWVQLLEERIRALPSGDPSRRELSLRRAQLLLESLGQAEEAAAAFDSLRAEDPEDVRVLDGLESALRAGGDVSALAELLEVRAGAGSDPVLCARRLLECATLREERGPADGEQARAHYETLRSELSRAGDAELAEIAAEADRCLERLLERQGDWSALRQLLEARVEAGGADGLALRERLARLCRDRLGDEDGAVGHLEAALALAPERSDLWRALGLLHDRSGRSAELARALEGELATGPDGERRITLHARCAHLARERGDDDNACEHYRALLGLDPGHSDAGEYLAASYERDGRHADLAALLEQRLAVAPSDRVLTLRLRLASLYGETLGDLAAAMAQLEHALALEGGDVAAEPLADLYERSDRDESLVALCRGRMQALGSGPERVRWCERLVRRLSQRGDDGSLAEAVEAVRSVLQERPGDHEARRSLCDLHRRREDWNALADELRAQLDPGCGEDPVAARAELAKLLDARLDRPEEALAEYLELLRQVPAHAEAFASAQRLAERLGRPRELLALVEDRLSRVVADAERASLLEQRADLLAGALERLDEAPPVYRLALALEPARSSARDGLKGALERLGRWHEVLDCLYLEARDADPERKAALCEQAAHLADDKLGRGAALPWWERLRALRPGDRTILAEIAETHRSAGRSESLLRVLEEELTLDPPGERRLEIECERARLLERAQRAPARAARALETARSLAAPDSRQRARILCELDRLYRELGLPFERVAVLEARIGCALAMDGGAASPELPALCEDAATLCEEALGDPARAVAPRLQALEWVRRHGGDEEGACRGLARVLREAGLIEAWARAAEARLLLPPAQDSAGVRERALLRRELADVYADSLMRPELACAHRRTLLDGAGSDALSDGERDEIELELLGALRAGGDAVELERRLTTRLDRAESGRAEDWLELARLREERLYRDSAAANAYARALELEPESTEALLGLRSASERLGDWARVVDCLEVEAQSAAAPRAAAACRRAGELSHRRLSDLERAARLYRRALELDAGDRVALGALRELAALRDAWQEERTLCQRELEHGATLPPETTRDLWLRIGLLERDRAENPEAARDAFDAAAAAAPLPAAAMREHADLHERTGGGERAAALRAAWCDLPGSGASARDQLETARALRDHGRDEEALERALRTLDGDVGAAESGPGWQLVAELQESRGAWREAADARVRAADCRCGLDHASAAVVELLRAVELLSPREPERAFDLLARARELDPAHVATLERSALLAAQLEQWDVAETCASRVLDLDAADGSGQLDAPRRGACAAAGARAARAFSHWERAAALGRAALDAVPDDATTRAALAETLYELGERAAALETAQPLLPPAEDRTGRAWPSASEARPAEARARICVIAAAGEEALGQPERAAVRYEQALAAWPGCLAAHEGRARVLAAGDDMAAAIAATEAWALAVSEPSERAPLWLRAAELSQRANIGDREQLLRRALECDPHCEPAALQLCEAVAARGDADALSAELERLLPSLRDREGLARLHELAAGVFEQTGRAADAARAWRRAAESDPRALAAALAAARLLRAQGDWRGADALLASFAAGHPEPRPAALARAYVERGRLLAGPLEDVTAAVACYEAALELDPETTDALRPLAQLLTHVPERHGEALVLLRRWLLREPASPAAIRGLVSIAAEARRSDLEMKGLAILRALGALSPLEAASAPAGIPSPIGETPAMGSTLSECLRRGLQEAGQGVAQALDGGSGPADRREPAEGPEALFWSVLREEEDQLGAPGVADLDDERLRPLLLGLVQIARGDEPGDASSSLAQIARDLGRWDRRRLRKIVGDLDLEEIRALDLGEWRRELRSLAAAAALDRCGGDLRTALLALSREPDDDTSPSESADLCARVSAAPQARDLLARLLGNLGAELAH